MTVMSRRLITIAFCFLMLFTVTAINLKPKNGNTPPCGTYGQESCITHSPPANQHERPCNPEEHCRGNEGLAASETESKSEVQASVATKTVQDYALLLLALLLVFAWNFDYYFLWEMLIGLCEFLSEHKEQSKLKEKEAKKQTKAQKSYDSDENKNGKEAKLSSLPDDCQKQMKAISSEEEISEWGLFVLGQQVLSSVKNSSVCEVPCQNITTWIKFTDVCCQVRCKLSVLSTLDCQELAEIIIFLFLDWRVQDLSVLMRSCMQSVISSITEEEWINSSSQNSKISCLKSSCGFELLARSAMHCSRGSSYQASQKCCCIPNSSNCLGKCLTKDLVFGVFYN